MPKLIEEWKPVVGYEGLYEASNIGNIKNAKNGRILKQNGKRYLQVNLSKNGVIIRKNVHRLVAEAFIPNSDNKPCVDHINGNAKDNRAENLRWLTIKENNGTLLAKTRKSTSMKGHIPYEAIRQHAENKSKEVFQYSKDGKLIKKYPSIREASRDNNFVFNGIHSCCVGGFMRNGKWINCKTYKGYIWSYIPL